MAQIQIHLLEYKDSPEKAIEFAALLKSEPLENTEDNSTGTQLHAASVEAPQGTL